MELPLAGIVPDGVVHPAVQSDTADTRGSGASLDSGLPERFADSLGELSYVRVHIDDTADRLNRSVSARAFATGTDVTSQRASTARARRTARLFAHEFAHVVQQHGAPSRSR